MDRRQVGSGPLRAIAYVIALFLLPPLAAHMAVQHDVKVNCHGGGECDLAGLAGFAAAVESVVLILAIVITIEVTLHVRRRRSQQPSSPTGQGSS